MKSFTEQLKSYEPEVLFSIKKHDVSVQFDVNEPYWSTEDSVIFNDYSPDYFRARIVRGNNKVQDYDPNQVGNQLTENEIYNENDYSLQIGRNTTNYNGVNYSYYRDEPFEEEYELYKEMTSYFQLKISSNDLKKRTRIINFENNDDYAVVYIDTNSPDHTHVFRSSYSFDEITHKETWGSSISPVLYRPHFNVNVGNGEYVYTTDFKTKDNANIEMDAYDGQNLNSKVTKADEFGDNVNVSVGETVSGNLISLDTGKSDKRIIYIALINPRTGEHYDSYRLMFDRKGTLVNGSNYTLADTPPKSKIHDIFEQKPYTGTSYTNSTKPSIDRIIIGYDNNGKERLLKKWVSGSDITVPILSDIKVVVNNNTITNRDFIIENISTPETYKFMQFMYFDLYYDHNNKYVKVYNKNTGANVYNITVPLDTTYIFAISMSYEYLPDHDPDNNKYNYNMKFKFKVNNVEHGTQTINYKGERYTFKDRGTGMEINTVPSFLNLPVVLGWMPKQSRDTRYGYQKYNFNIGEHTTQCDYIKYFNYSIPTNIINIDNLSFFDGDYVYNDYYNLYYKSFSNSNRILDQNLVNYWGCDNLNSGLNVIKNRFNGDNSLYNLYSDMKLVPVVSKHGYAVHEKENHRAIKNSIRFENITGDVHLYNTWSRSGNYTISFWFKSTQKTKGVILADYNNKVYNSSGVYFGLVKGGYLELRINDFNARTYENYSITDGEWHLIVLRVSPTATSTNNNYTLYVDNQIMDRFDGAIRNKESLDSYQLYFMGHPQGNNVNGNLAKISFYNVSLSTQLINLMYEGDIEHNVQGTILLENMPIKIEVRVYNNRTGKLVSKIESDNDSGIFIYRNYNNFDVYIVVVDKTKMFGDIQTIGPIEPKSIE